MQFNEMKQIHDVTSRVLLNEVGFYDTLAAELNPFLWPKDMDSSSQHIYFGSTNHEGFSL